MPDEAVKVAYDEGVRALTQQAGVLDNLRARAGTVIAAASLVTTFLGGQSIAKPTLSNGVATYQSFNGWAWAAVAAFVCTIVLALAVLVPWWGWKFVTSPTVIIGWQDGTGATLGGTQRDLALWFEDFYDSNESTMNYMWIAFTLSCVALVAEVGLWIIYLGTGHDKRP